MKVGDWVIEKSNKELKQIKIEKSECLERKLSLYERLCELWEPKEGEWCWFYDIITDDKNKTPYLNQFQRRVMGINGKYTFECKNNNLQAFTYCEPFIGELPSFIKDKQ